MELYDFKNYLDEKVCLYNTPAFIEHDPILLPHRFSKREDIEIVGFLVATIAWGNRVSIIKNGEKLIQIMGNNPHAFIMDYSTPEDELIPFVHRTFNAIDLDFFFRSLRSIYEKGGLESVFYSHPEIKGIKGRIVNFRKEFLSISGEKRSEKHVPNVLKGSAAKRINMFLRWMVRKDNAGVDFGIWDSIPMHELHIPLDVHTGTIARKLGLIQREKDDWQALDELQSTLIKLDPNDPAKYDFALFGLGVYEKDLFSKFTLEN
jgi:uncharacterized protein (TIGR02757 family)